MNSKKEAWYFKNIHYLFNQALGAKRSLITNDGDELARPMNTDAVKKYFVKKKLDKSQT